MGQEQHKFILPEGTTEIIVREGKAAEIIPPQKFVAVGDILAPAKFWAHKLANALIDITMAVVTYNDENGIICLEVNPEDKMAAIVTGKLELNEDLKTLQINGSRRWTREELLRFVRLNGLLFPNKDKRQQLINSLQSLSIKTEKNSVAANDNRGNKNFAVQTTLQTEISMDMTLEMPLFKGMEKKSFVVEIMLEDTDAGTKFWLESPLLADLVATERERIMADELAKFSGANVIQSLNLS